MTFPFETAALQAVNNAGLDVDSIPWGTGLQRVRTFSKPTKKNGAIVAHSDFPATVWFMNYETSETGTWTAKSTRRFTPQEEADLQARIAENRRRREIEDTA